MCITWAILCFITFGEQSIVICSNSTVVDYNVARYCVGVVRRILFFVCSLPDTWIMESLSSSAHTQNKISERFILLLEEA